MAWRRAGLMRGWSCSARDTVEGETPAAAAMSVMEIWLMAETFLWVVHFAQTFAQSERSIAEGGLTVKKTQRVPCRGMG